MSRVGICLGLAVLTATWANVTPAWAKAAKKVPLTVEGSMVGAKVLVDGKEVGKTPLKKKEIAVGAHTITVKKLGYLDFTEKIQATAGKPISVFADMLPFAGVLRVSANVAKATVSVDGKQVGKAPLEYEVKLGQHTITVSAPGYSTYTQTVSADPGSEYQVKANLNKGNGGGAVAGPGLELVPLTGPPGTGKNPHSKGTKSNAASAGVGGVDDLALAPLPGGTSPQAGGGSAANEPGLEAPPLGDGLALEPLASLKEIRAASVTPGAPSPGAMGPTSGVVATVESAKPWYKEWWVWTAAAAVVVTGVSVGIWAGTRNQASASNVVKPELCWDTDPATGGASTGCTIYTLHSFH